MRTSLPKLNPSVVSSFCRNKFMNESWLSQFHFAVSNFVFELALFCTSDFHKLTDVYNHRFWCHFEVQKNFPNELAVCSEVFNELKLVVETLDICTKNTITVRKPETFLMWVCNRKVFLQKTLPLVNMKLILKCCHCAVWACDWEGSTLFYFCLYVWTRNCWRPFLEFRASFEKVLFTLMPNLRPIVLQRAFGLAQDLTSFVDLRSHDYKHFCCKLHEVRHFEEDFGFETVLDLRYTVS